MSPDPSFKLISWLTDKNGKTTDLNVEVWEKANECDHVAYLEVEPSHREATRPYDRT